MKRFLRLFLLAGCAAAPLWAVEVVPIEIRQTDTPYNLQSQRGAPISATVNVPPGSDGRQPTVNESHNSVLPATVRQFSGFVAFGGIAAPTNTVALSNSTILRAGTDPFSPIVAAQMQLPMGLSNNVVVMVARRTLVGAPYMSRQISFLFGSVIPVPSTDENGALLTNVVKETYWLPEPYSVNGHTNAPYYWSPHARKVFAIQPGPVQVVWKKASSTTTQPPGYVATNYVIDGGNYFRLYNQSYVVSGSAVKTPRKIYWTEKTFQSLSKLINVPPARVGAVNIVYNNNFPKTVGAEFVAAGQTSPTDGSTNAVLQELRTLWFDQQQGSIHAYNKEGRVFVELLGDTRSDGQSRVQLGFEVVDVFKQVNPVDLTIELGERVTPPQPATLDKVFPEPVFQVGGTTFVFQQAVEGSDTARYFATRETRNLNDFMVHWMEEGEAQLRWPVQFARYSFVWPNMVEKFSHYVRPNVATEAEAAQTAVPLATENVPTIEYQDPLDLPRAHLNEEFKFYTFLTPQFPAHRTLLRFSSGANIAFERVFSWLDTNLMTTNFVGTVATNLAVWDSTNLAFAWPNQFQAPRVVQTTVDVGQRILAPSGEAGADGDSYMAGYIRQAVGTSFHPGDYVDPFVGGFANANKGAIIPVNAIPNKNQLEIYWFRANRFTAATGFQPINWPAVVGYYTIQWPANPLEIVLASNQGSAGNDVQDPLVALGSIYTQNDSALPGYNPNEEHALMSGGVAFALRDDLNNTNTVGYSSHPFVLVDYKAADQRPAVAVYKVLREKPSAGLLFDYIVKAGTLLQAPMPLPLLPPPIEGSGANAQNYNVEPGASSGDLPVAWDSTNSPSGPLGHYARFTYRDRKHGYWVYRGLHAGLPALQAGAYNTNSHTFAAPPAATAVVGQPFVYNFHASRQDQFLTILLETNSVPAWLQVSGLALQGTPAVGDIGTSTFDVVVSDFYENVRVTNSLTLNVAASGVTVAQAPLTVTSSNQYTGSIIGFTNRPPFLAHSPASSNSFTMRFYYKTMAGFAWPGLANPPTVGAIVPYLRKYNATNGTFVGDPKSKDTAALDIVYRPVWPTLDPKDESKLVPTLPYGQTLTKPANGLPGVRDFKTAHILYQQSVAANITNATPSLFLIDPTREKTSDLATQNLSKLPSGINTDFYQGKYFFPNLPPHLSGRLFFDPARGAKGSLVLQGEFKDDPTGEKYVLLNVLRDADLAAALAVCPAGDVDYSKWSSLVNGLSTAVQVFNENPAVPGTYIPDANAFGNSTAGVGDLAVVKNQNTAVDSYALSATGPGAGYVTLLESSGDAFTQPGDPVAMHIFKVGGSLYTGELKVIPASNPLSEQVTLQHTSDFAGRSADYAYEWKIGSPVDGLPPIADATMSTYISLTNGNDIIRYTIGGAGVRALSDNYVVMRYRPIVATHPLYRAAPTEADWSSWTRPALAEGWIKRVLAGINPFNQRTSDLFNNRVNTDVSIISQAGHRWEGDVALNASTLNNYGLIEIYETVLRRGRSLSIESGFNYGPANDALLLAAGYLNDLYMMLGNEAWSDGSNPTIGIGTKDHTYSDIATALFSFKGQQPSLLEEELALLRGRDDFLLPSVEVAPFYNRLPWNYTRGIDAGEVIYALNYNILDQDDNGVVDAADAAKMFPQAHGDAYGHFLTAVSGYYSLLVNQNFDWAPRIEAVNVLGQPVSVDYLDERKFAAAAAAMARAANQILDLTWRKDYTPGRAGGWDYLGVMRSNAARQFVNSANETNISKRYWGVDHWATRGGLGAYVDWLTGNAILPAVDPNSAHEGIQKIDRTTVPELEELVTTAQALQATLENAEGGLTPLGLPEGGLAFDINPNQVVGAENGTHFEQVFQRAKAALNNAVSAFDDAKDVTRLMRSEEDSQADLRVGLEKQELSYTNSLIEIYGQPYSDDVGPGKLYPQGYSGPDLFHFVYTDSSELTVSNLNIIPNASRTFKIDTQTFSATYEGSDRTTFDFVTRALNNNPDYSSNGNYISLVIDTQGNFQKPSEWSSKRAVPGKIQDAIGRIILARNNAREAAAQHQELKRKLDRGIEFLDAKVDLDDALHYFDKDAAIIRTTLESVAQAAKIGKMIYDQYIGGLEEATKTAIEFIPKVQVFGLAMGGDVLSTARGTIAANYAIQSQVNGPLAIAKEIIVGGLTVAKDGYLRDRDANVINPAMRDLETARIILELDANMAELQNTIYNINARLNELDAAVRNYQSVVAQGQRLQEERHVFRQRAAAVVQGFRTRDAAFRLFRNEKLDRYKTLFDLSARYAYLAANAYDYETGLLDSNPGRKFVNRIVSSRALGVVRNGEPQFAGSNTGDPGLSSALAEMKADWDVLRGRLGFNNPDAYGTTVSLRTENFRILPGADGLANWKDLLKTSSRPNLLEDADVKRYCMQIAGANGLPVPGLLIEFSTSIEDGYNLFGRLTAAGDHNYSPSSFATKIFGVGVALEGYRGMDNPVANNGAVNTAGGTSPNDPPSWYLDPLALNATPYIYLIPVGQDAMRSPPLGDGSALRTWNVADVAIPLPFNIGGSDFSSNPGYTSGDSLSEPLFAIRKHQAFRPVSTTAAFSPSLYTTSGGLQRSQFMNNRLVGRSVWNTKWKLVIPAKTLLSDESAALDRFMQTVSDIKIHLVTYSYSGN